MRRWSALVGRLRIWHRRRPIRRDSRRLRPFASSSSRRAQSGRGDTPVVSRWRQDDRPFPTPRTGVTMSVPEHIWAYCDACQDTRPVNGIELREYLTNGTPHSYTDLVCAVCCNVVAIISIGPSDGSPPVQSPLQVPPREQTAPPDEETDSPLRRVQRVDLRRDAEHVGVSVAAKKGTKMAAKWSPAGRAVRSEPFPLLRSVVRNGPEPSRARRCWARRSEPLTARTVLR